MIYIGVQGQTTGDTFSVDVWDQLFDLDDIIIDVIEGPNAGEIIYEVGTNLKAAASGER